MNKVWACTSVGSCITSFIVASLPYLQWIAVVFSIAAAIKAWRNDKKK